MLRPPNQKLIYPGNYQTSNRDHSHPNGENNNKSKQGITHEYLLFTEDMPVKAQYFYGMYNKYPQRIAPQLTHEIRHLILDML